MFKILIVEDESIIALDMKAILEENNYTVSSIANTGEKALNQIEAESPDLILLDIQLAGSIDGIDIANIINAKFHIPFIFITSNNDKIYLERVKFTNPKGFISKPYTESELIANIDRVKSETESNNSIEREIDHIFIKKNHNYQKVYFQDILYVQAMDNYSMIYLKDDKLMVPHTLKRLLSILEPFGFAKSHRSYLVQVQKVKLIGINYLEIESHKVPVSESSKKLFLKQINTL